jgi:hypothetical protein
MSAFADATGITALSTYGAGRTFTWEVPDGWQQGRGAYGGLPIGAMVSAVEQTDSDRPVRSVSLQLAGPALVGRHTVRVHPIRIGSRMSTWSVSVESDEGLVASGAVISGVSRSADEGQDAQVGAAQMPAVPPSENVPVVDTPPPFPTFTQHLSFAPVSGFPLSGGSPETTGWVNFREPVRPTAASLLALADGWYTATLIPMKDLRPIATVNFAATLVVDPNTLDADQPLLHHGLVTATRDGFASEQRRLWTADGRLAVDNLQTMAVG